MFRNTVMAGAVSDQPRFTQVLEKEPFVSSSAALSGRPVQQGYVASIDAVDDGVDTYNVLPSGNYRIEMWLKINGSNGGSYNYILSFGSAFQNGFVRMLTSTRVINFGDGGDLSVSTSPITYGQWHHLVIEWDGSSAKLILDGVQSVDSSTTYSFATGRIVHLGTSYAAAGSGSLNGSISCVNIFSNGSIWAKYKMSGKGGIRVFDCTGNNNHAFCKNGASFSADNSIPGECDSLNKDGYSRGKVPLAGSARIRYDVGTIDSFEFDRVKVRVYLPDEFTAASSGKRLLNLSSTNGALSLMLGSNSGLVNDETLMFNGNTSTRNYITENIPAGFHDIEFVYDGSGRWDLILNGVAKTTLYHGSSTSRTCDQVWVGPSQNGSNGVVGAIYTEVKIWNNGELKFDLSLDSADVKDKISEKQPDTLSMVDVLVPVRDDGYDVFGNQPQYAGSVYPSRPRLKQSYCPDFDGTDDYITVIHDQNFNLTLTNSLSFCFRVEQSMASTRGVLMNGLSDSGGNNNYYIYFSTNTCRIYLGSSGGATDSLFIPNCESGDFICITVEGNIGGQIKGYRNGVYVGSTTRVVTPLNTDNDLRIGRLAAFPMDGNIFDVRIYESILGLEDIRKVMNLESISESPLLDLPLAEGSGSIVFDKSGNNYHGEVKSAATGSQGSGFWSGRQDVFHSNYNDGFSLCHVLSNSGVSGWGSSGGYSNESATGDFELKVVVDQVGTFRMIGMTSDPGVGSHYNTIDYAIYLTSTTMQVYENGSSIASFGGLSIGQEVMIKRVGSEIQYWQSGTLRYTSLVASSGELWVDVAMNSSNASIGIVRLNGDYVTWTGLVNAVSNQVRVPARDFEFDVLGEMLTNRSLDVGHNNAETQWDIYNIAEGSNPCPASFGNAAASSVIFSDTNAQLQLFPPVNTIFRRDKSSVCKDRLAAFSESLTGSDLTELQNYTT